MGYSNVYHKSLIFLWLSVCCCSSTTNEHRQSKSNLRYHFPYRLKRHITPSNKTNPNPVHYTLDLLASPPPPSNTQPPTHPYYLHTYNITDSPAQIAREDFQENVQIDVQFLPWSPTAGLNPYSSGCLNFSRMMSAAKIALSTSPPPAGMTLRMLPPPEDSTCTEKQSVMFFLTLLTSSPAPIIVGGLEPSLCRVASHLAEKYGKLLILWSCHEAPALYSKLNGDVPISSENKENVETLKSNRRSNVAIMTPVAEQLANCVRVLVQHLGWRRISILTIDSIYWKGIADSIDEELRKWRHLVPAMQVLANNPTKLELTSTMQEIPSSSKAIIVVIPTFSAVLGAVLRAAATHHVPTHAAIIVVDPLHEKENFHLYSPYRGEVENNTIDISNYSTHEEKLFAPPPQIAHLPTEVSRSILWIVPAALLDEADTSDDFALSHLQDDHINSSLGNDTFESREVDEIMNRLAFDSVSLTTHALRRNIRLFHYYKRKNKPQLHNNAPNCSQSSANSLCLESLKSARSFQKLSLPQFQKFNSTFSEKPQTMKMHEDILSDVHELHKNGQDLLAEKRLRTILALDFFNSANKHNFETRKRSQAQETNDPLTKYTVFHSTFFNGLRGKSFLKTTGIRSFQFLVLDWNPENGMFSPVMRIKELKHKGTKKSNGELHIEDICDIDWAYDKPIPRDPLCELLAKDCFHSFNTRKLSAAYVVMIILLVVLMCCGACVATFFIRSWMRQKAMSKGPYKILLNSGDITLTSKTEFAPKKIGSAISSEKPDLLRGRNLNVPSPKNSRLPASIAGCSLREADEIRAKYNGDFVHMRYFYSPGHFEVKNRTISLLKQMHDLRHENVNSFLGLLCDPIRPGFVFDYGSRGSLEDIIKQEDIKLDWSFRLSLLTDLVRGMRYIHSSPLKAHGRLTSRNCVIDGRWVLKITDYGLSAVYETQNIAQPHRALRDLLYKAPELLRNEAVMMKGTQAGDVFAFAIIMQEIVVRGEPYCMVQLTVPEILVRLRKPPPMIRPSVSKGAAPPDAINIMKQCWAELPEMRPDSNQIYDSFKKLNEGRRLNIVDTMFQMLEKYSSNLEELIRERTEQLDVEKKKTEQLLNRMLPSSVADQLKLGMPVAPEEFDEVTIYFSDIVGFTTISAYSTPFEVVDLLNDLYTTFDVTINHYNVYKVETIGDAYMVVGGVPTAIDDHASQVATMALDLLHVSGKFRIRHLHNIPLMLRIGMHSGPCCAGVVGTTMPRYCLFGDTVNTASRMESTGSAWRIHISEATARKLREAGGYQIEYRGKTLIKGKGLMPTYWLLGKHDFNKDMPKPPEIGQAQGLDEELSKLGRQHYTARRDSMNESAISALSSFNQHRLASQKTNQLTTPYSSIAIADPTGKSKLRKPPPVIVRVETVDGTGLCLDSTRLSPLLQSPQNSHSENCQYDATKENDTYVESSLSFLAEKLVKNKFLIDYTAGASKRKSLSITDDKISQNKLEDINPGTAPSESDTSTTVDKENLCESRNVCENSLQKRKKSNAIDTEYILSNLNEIRKTIDAMGKEVALRKHKRELENNMTTQLLPPSNLPHFTSESLMSVKPPQLCSTAADQELPASAHKSKKANLEGEINFAKSSKYIAPAARLQCKPSKQIKKPRHQCLVLPAVERRFSVQTRPVCTSGRRNGRASTDFQYAHIATTSRRYNEPDYFVEQQSTKEKELPSPTESTML